MNKQNNKQFRGLKRRIDKRRALNRIFIKNTKEMEELFGKNIIFWSMGSVKGKQTIDSVIMQIKFPEPVNQDEIKIELVSRIGDLLI